MGHVFSKPSVFASRPLAYAMESLSKNALIDLVVDLARREIGEDASDSAIAALVEKWHGPVANHRGDKPPRIFSALNHWHDAAAKHAARQVK